MNLKIKIQDKATIVVLNCAFSWGTVTDKEITDETTSDKHAVHGSIRVRKTLLPKASGHYVEAVRAALSQFYSYHVAHTYSTPIKGQRIMPTAFYMDYMQAYGEAQASARSALDALVQGYPDAVKHARTLLGSAFKVDDYPDVQEIPRYFTLDVRFLPVPSGDQIMNALGSAVACDVDSYVDEIMKDAAADAKKRLRDAVARMAKQLLTKGGKIYDSLPGSINELASSLPEIAGLAGDSELQALVKEVKDVLSGYSGNDFRKDEATRTAVGAAAMQLLKKMGG